MWQQPFSAPFTRLAGLLCVVAIPTFAQVVITPSAPQALQQGKTLRFTANREVTWSLAPGSPGSIDPDGVYHAPESVVPSQSLAGCQVFPNNSIFNVPIDNLPKHPQSDDFIAWTKTYNGGNHRLAYSPGTFPLTHISGGEVPTAMKFFYTPANDSAFPLPPYPGPLIEGGYWARGDRHVILVDHNDCKGYEMFALYGSVAKNPDCPGCNAQSGAKIDFRSNKLLLTGGTDVASLPLTPLIFRPEELKAGAINHALRVTLHSPRNTFIWPALATSNHYTADTKSPPVGARFRLKADFDISGFSPAAQTVLTALKKYGVIVADRGYNWNVIGSGGDYDTEALNAFSEIRAKVTGDAMEAVDQSSLMLAPNSGETLVGDPIVVATSVEDASRKAEVVVHLFGVAVGVPRLAETIQAGAAKQLDAWVSGADDNSVTWSMDSTLGTLSPSGLYSAPEDVPGPNTVTVTATSNADPAKSASIKITILPAGIIRINAASAKDYIGSDGNAWWGDVGYSGGDIYTYPSLTVTGTADAPLYRKCRAANADIFYSFSVPNGIYRVTIKIAEVSEPGPRLRDFHLEAQGQIVYRNVDPFAAAGGKGIPIDFDMPAVVTDGSLLVALRYVGGDGPIISALQISPDSGTPKLTIAPAKGGSVPVLGSKQFDAVRWYLRDGAVRWSIAPAVGSINSEGIYTGPEQPVSEPTAVTVTATSVVDPLIKASATLTVLPGVPDIRINCGDLPGFIDADGNVWSADYGAVGGVVYDNDVVIAGTTPDMQRLYQSARYGYDNQAFYYSFPEPNGVYRVTLKFAEYSFTSGTGHHVFDVKINGTQVLTNFDITIAAEGNQRAVDKTFTAVVTNSVMRLDFIGHQGGALINGIQILYLGPRSSAANSGHGEQRPLVAFKPKPSPSNSR